MVYAKAKAKAQASKAPMRRKKVQKGRGFQKVRRYAVPSDSYIPGHHYDAFAEGPPQSLAFTVGPATHFKSYMTTTVTVPVAADNRQVLIFNPVPGRVCGFLFGENTIDTWTPTVLNIDGGFTNAEPSTGNPGQPDTAMCSRFSVRIRNVSVASDAGGVVKVLRMSSGMDGNANDDVNETIAYLKSTPRTVVMSGSALTETHQWDAIPVSQDTYHHFRTPNIDDSTFLAQLKEPAMSTLVFLFEQIGKEQTYNITVAGSYYGRWRTATVLANMASPPPTSPLSVINKARSIADSVGSMGHSLAPALQQGIGGFLGNLISQARPGPMPNYRPMLRPMLGAPIPRLAIMP